MKCLHIHFSREYIENELGKPQSVSEIVISKKSYFRTIYTDKYYTLLCYYNDTGSLFGFYYIGFVFTDIGYHSERIESNMDTENAKINFITVFKEYNFNENIPMILLIS